MYYYQPITHRIKQGDSLYQLARYYQTTVPEILALNKNINPQNLEIGSEIWIQPGDNFNMPQQSNLVIKNSKTKLMNSMRLAWGQHVYWTRMLLISIAGRMKDQEATTHRLLRNPYDIADIFKNYYSAPVANKIAQLLSEHLQIGAALITALRDENSGEAERLNRQWYQNADQMAEAFGQINPYYDYDTVRNMLYKHLDLTTQEVKMRLAKNYPADIEAFDLVEKEALAMADMFSTGIMHQFPRRF